MCPVDNYHWCLSSVILRGDIFFSLADMTVEGLYRLPRGKSTQTEQAEPHACTDRKWAKQVNSSIYREGRGRGDMGNMFGACFIIIRILFFLILCVLCVYINLCV